MQNFIKLKKGIVVMGDEEKNETNDVEKFVISNEDFEKYFNKKEMVSAQEIIEYYIRKNDKF